jgi:hypothetical protein
MARALIHGIEEDHGNIEGRNELVQEGELVGFQVRGRWRRGFDVFFGNNFHLHFSLSTLGFRKLTPAKKSKFFSSAASNLKITEKS